jgi:CO/xanthine dehydrogenase Mo-binding subunit
VTSLEPIGVAGPRIDGVAKVTGEAKYAVDQSLSGMLFGRLLHSSRPHARIVRLDTSAAAAFPGVHAVITSADVGDHLYGRRIKDMPVLARDLVRYVGERIAAVAADSEEIARRAVDLIEVEYEDLPSVFSIDDALADSAPILHPDYGTYPGSHPLDAPSNCYFEHTINRGDIESAFAEADLVVENTFETARVHQAYLEPHASLVHLDRGRVHVWTNTKAPQAIRDVLAFTADISRDDIVLHRSTIGGDFGGKGTPLNLPICYFLARAAGQPVRMVADYIEEFGAGSPRHATLVHLKTGVMNDGTLVAHHVRFLVNSGAYAAYKPNGVIGGAPRAAGPYRVANSRIEASHVYTNTVPGGHMRSPGSPQAVFALESQLDEIARRLDIDPLRFRLHNLVEDGDDTAWGEQFEHVRLKETLESAAEAAGYDSPKAPFIGRGIAIGDHGAGGGIGNAEVVLHPGGSIVLGTAIFDQGTGTYTTLQQVVAGQFRVPTDRVSIEVWDTDGTDNDSGIGGSRGTRVNTTAAYEAAQDARRALIALVAERFDQPEDQIEFETDEVRIPGRDPIRWPDLLTEIEEPVTGRVHIEERSPARITGFVAQIAEVAVDPETGKVDVLRFTTAHDVGRVLNPVGHQGQINGGVVQGIGYSLMEELQVEDGRVTTLSFGDFKIPVATDLPPLQTVLVESEHGVGPYRIKGIGETPNTPVAAAIANAVCDAVGVRIFNLPITSEKVHHALHQREN